MRQSFTVACLPGGVSATRPGSSAESSMVFPFQARITSPGLMPARAAGLLSATELTSAPSGFANPNDCARLWFTDWMATPMRPRVTWPLLASSSFTCIATSIGMANDTPI